MKFALLAAATVPLFASGFILPNTPMVQNALNDDNPPTDSVPPKPPRLSNVHDFAGGAIHVSRTRISTTEEHDDAAAHDDVTAIEEIESKIKDDLSDAVLNGDDGPHHHGHHGHNFPDHSIYELISKSKYTRKFANYVNKFPDLVDLLNGTSSSSSKHSHNFTLFVPLDEAFERASDGQDKLGKESLESLLRYHIAIGSYRAEKFLVTHTVPSALTESFLGGEHQRLRTSFDFSGVKVNFFSKAVAANIGAKNGIIHAVDHVLVPPSMVGRELTFYPQYFSTLLLAYEKTDFVKYIHNVKMIGSTIFTPTNSAWAWLGRRANDFLFNTETGHKYLRALLKYQIAPNATLYTDAFYDKRDSSSDEDDEKNNEADESAGKDEERVELRRRRENDDEEEKKEEAKTMAHEHYDLTTLLGDAHVAVDINRLGGYVNYLVNGRGRLTATDVVAKNGVIQVTSFVLVPPHKHHGKDTPYTADKADMSVEELKERLGPYVE